MRSADRRAALAAFAWLILVGWLTLRSAPAQAAAVAETPWYCIACGGEGVADLLLNILLFLPFGIAARALGWPALALIAFAFVFSVSIELVQGLLLVGRDASLGDVIANTAGGGLGWLALPMLRRLAEPGRKARAARGVFVLAATAWLAGAAGSRPALDGNSAWVSELLPRSEFTDSFAGTVDSLSVNGTPVASGQLADPVGGDSLAVNLVLTRRDTLAPRRPVRLARVTNASRALEIDLSQVGQSLVVQARLVSSRWRLHMPGWQFERALAIPVGRPWRFVIHWRSDAMTLVSTALDGSAPVRPMELPISAALGWAYIHPFVYHIGASAALWASLWVAWWFGVLGWLSGGARTRTSAAFGVAALVVYVVVSALYRLAIIPSELVIGAVAFTLAATATSSFPGTRSRLS